MREPRRGNGTGDGARDARIAWADADRIDREADHFRKAGQPEALWRLTLSVPLPDGVRLARRLARLDPDWHPDSPLFARLAAVDEHLVAAVAATAARASCSVFPLVTGRSEWLSFGFGDPVLTLTSFEPPGITRISMLRDGAWNDVYVGDLDHYAVACIDADNVIAVRDDPEHDRSLVHYTPRSTRPVLSGLAVTGTQPAATAAGFVAGLGLQPAAMVAGPELEPDIKDLRPFGLVTADRLAVDPTGQAVAFGGERDVVVTDARVEYLVARSVVRVPHGPVLGLAFTTPTEVVTGGDGGGLSRWKIAPREALVLEASAGAPRLSGLFAVPAWGVIGGRDDGEGIYRFFDPVTLEPVDPPRSFIEARYNARLVHAVAASTDGRFAAVGGQLFAFGPRPSTDFALAVYDFHHPLARVLRPVASLDDNDVEAVSRAAADADRCTDVERQVLDLLRDVARHRLGDQAPT